MNKCTFLGQTQSIVFDPAEQRIKIVLKVGHKRKSKNEQVIDYDDLIFEAWGGASFALFNSLRIGEHLLVIDSTARQYKENICFRINEFKIIK
jgi:hypothetical protein